MKNNRLAIAIIFVAVVLGAAGALLWPLFRPGGEPPYTLVSTSLGMTPDKADWLDLGDPRDPAEWLAGRSGTPAAATQMGALLAETARHYEETPRMIANRVAQVADQISDRTEPELLAGFAFETGRARSFGAVAQHYLVLRRQGVTHEAALATLRAEAAGEDRG